MSSADIARPALTRAQRRRLRTIADRVDLVTQADRAFFLRRPERQHRVRISHPAEIEQLRIVSGKPLAAPAGCRHFTVVRNVAPGVRWRVFVLNDADAETDLPEELARTVWKAAETSYVREFVADLRKVMAVRS
jgi:hypothetical protein